MSTESERVESDSDVDFDGNVSDTSETLAEAMSSRAVMKRKTQSVGLESNGGEIKNDSAKRQRYVLVYKEEDDDSRNGLDSDAEIEDVESVKEESKVENLDGVVLGSGVENLKLSESDLVWGKVRSYPWWPGQVVDASVASKMAKKHFKKGKVLVVYFGDGSFAWNDVSKIKPFHQHFGKMMEQSNSLEFRYAVDCALEEVERRVEFGLSCGCISKEAYMKLKTQNIVNAGIREESRVRYGGDQLSNVMYFEPVKLLLYMKDLACFPSYDATEKLQFVSNRAQLLAFQQWKGYPDPPGFEAFLRSVESAVPEVFLLESDMDEEKSSKKRKKDNKDAGQHKEMFGSEDRTDEETEGKTLSDFIAKKRAGSKLTEKVNGKLQSEKKRKVESLISGKSEKKIKNNSRTEDLVTPNSDEENNLSVGDAKREELAPKKITSLDQMLSNLDSNEDQKGILEPISTDPSNYEELDQFMKEISCSNVNDDLKKPSNTETSGPIDVIVISDEQSLPGNKDITDSGSKEQTADSSAPIALILNFADSASVPSEEKLNKAFNHYGPLIESETKVMKKSARVVFKKIEDAETAFSSAGKYSIFGPALLSYKLKYV